LRYVLDASVAVAAARPQEPSYAAAFERVSRVLAGIDAIVVPALFRIEVASALARTRFEPRWIDAHVDQLLASATVVVVGPVRSRRVQRVAMTAKLRAADATYVWLAAREAVPLVTLDEEVFARAAGYCQVERP
jgi:predicted nucleic acid-binding protein